MAKKETVLKNIKTVLRRYVTEAPLGDSAQPGIDRPKLQGELRRIVSQNQVYFNLAIAMPLLLFVGLLAAVWSHLDQPEWVRALSVATGVSFIGMIAITANLWKTKVTAETVMALAGSLPQEALTPVIAALIGKL